MVSFYSVVQYVPCSIADERINVGVITFDDDGLHHRFLTDWRRVEAFGGEPIDFLHEFADEFEHRGWTAELVHRASREWANGIQLTRPRASTLTAAVLLDRIGDDMLVEPDRERRRPSPERRGIPLPARSDRL